MKKLLISTLALLGLCSAATSYATTYQLPLPGNNVIGQVQTAYAQPGQTIDDVARQYDIGFYSSD